MPEDNAFDRIGYEQGWSDDTKLDLLRAFIAEKGLDDDLVEWAQKKADEENAG